VDRKMPPCTLGGQQVGCTSAVLAETEIVANGGARDPEAMQQHVVHKVLGRGFRERGVEGEHDGAVKPRAREQAQLGAIVGQAEQRLLWAKEAAWMRLEGQRRRWSAERARAGERCSDHSAVAAMYAIEIADGDDGAFEPGVGAAGPALNHERRIGG